MGTHYQGEARETRALDTYIKLMRAANTLTATLARRLSEAHLTDSQFGVMETLLHLGPLHQCQIAEKLLKSGANITTVLDNLEKRGLISRERDPDDRRSTTIHLTDAGAALINELFPRQAVFIADQMESLSAEEQAHLGDLCRKLGTGISK